MKIRYNLQRFCRDFSGTAVVLFGLAFLPVMMVIGSAVDYQRAAVSKSEVQRALDQAVVAGAAQPSPSSISVATTTFNANVPSSLGASATFQAGESGLSGKAAAKVPTSVMQLVGVNSISITASAAASYSSLTSASSGYCIVAMASGMSSSTNAFTLNGAPDMELKGCGVISNASMRCNGHDGAAATSAAVGGVSGCDNPAPQSAAYVDNFTTLASGVAELCSGNAAGVTWTAGTVPSSGPNFLSVTKSNYIEYHVCGDLTVKGSGSLATNAVFVIEDGNLNISGGTNVSAKNSAFVLTGDDSKSHRIVFPSGKGQGATLSVSAPATSTNPWHGIAIYVDPSLTSNVDNNFGSGANLVFDGIVYMRHSDLTLSGNTGSGAGHCSMLLVDTFTTNGSAAISFVQSAKDCVAAGISKQLNARLTR